MGLRAKKKKKKKKEFSTEEYWMAEKHLKKMFNILNHQENANQNNPEISLLISQCHTTSSRICVTSSTDWGDGSQKGKAS